MANLEKCFTARYVEVYIWVLILWKTHKGAHSNHIRQTKLKKTPQKWRKLANLRNIWNIKGYFGKTFSLKSTKIYMIRKTTLTAFHRYLFHENILFTSEVTALLETAYSHWSTIFWNFITKIAKVHLWIGVYSWACVRGDVKPYVLWN